MLTTVVIIWLFKGNWSGTQDSTETLICSSSIYVELLSLGLSHELEDSMSKLLSLGLSHELEDSMSKLLALLKNVLFSNSLAITFHCFHVLHYSFLRIHSCLASSPVPWVNQFHWVCFTRHPNRPRCVCLFELQLELILAQIANKHSVCVCMCLSVSYKQGLIFFGIRNFSL